MSEPKMGWALGHERIPEDQPHVTPVTCTTRILDEDGAPCGEPASFVGNTTDGGSAYACPNGHKTFRYLTSETSLADHLAAPPADEPVACRSCRRSINACTDEECWHFGWAEPFIHSVSGSHYCFDDGSQSCAEPASLATHLAAGIDAILGG